MTHFAFILFATLTCFAGCTKETPAASAPASTCTRARACCEAFKAAGPCDWEFQKGDGSEATCSRTLAGYRNLATKLATPLPSECE